MKKKAFKERSDFPIEYFTGEPHLELYGNTQCVVDGLKSVLEYSAERIKLSVGKRAVTFIGQDLFINSFSPEGAVVEGFIAAMEFSDAC